MTAFLEEAFGDELLSLLRADRTTDVMLNEDGAVWIDGDAGRQDSGVRLSVARAQTILRLLASAARRPVTEHSPVLDNIRLPWGQRFAGTIPPVTIAPTFSIRLPYSRGDIGVDDFRATSTSSRATPSVAGCIDGLVRAVRARRHVLLAGSTGSGKTTLANVLLREMASERLVVIESMKELIITGKDHIRFLAVEKVVDAARLLALALRYRPDRIIVDELRTSAETAVFLQAANTGHGGNLTTLHANSAHDAVDRLEDMVGNAIPIRAIRAAVDVIAFMEDHEVREVIDLQRRPAEVRAIA